MKYAYLPLLGAFLTLISETASAQCSIQEKTVTAGLSDFQCKGSTKVTVGASQEGVSYTLFNDTKGQPVPGAAVPGNGNDVELHTGLVTSTSAFSVKASLLEQGKALLFDGVDDYVSLGTLGDFGSVINNSAIELWIKTTDKSRISAPLKIINRNSPGNIDNDIVLAIECNRALESSSDNLLKEEAGSTLFYIRDNEGKVCAGHITANIYDGQWHHIAMNIINASNGQMEVYVDGVKRNFTRFFNANPSGWENWSDEISLGASNTRGTQNIFFSGEIADLRFWDQSRTALEISSLMNFLLQGDEAGLFAYYDFKDVPGSTLSDKKGVYHGTLINMNTDAWTNSFEQVVCQSTLAQTVNITVSELKDQEFIVEKNPIWCSGATSILMQNSETGVEYTLETLEGMVVDGPYTGNGSVIAFATGNLTENTTLQMSATGLHTGALTFDGTDDHVLLGTLGTFGSQVKNSAVEFWVKTTDKSVISAPIKIIESPGDAVYAIEFNRALRNTTSSELDYQPGATLVYLRDNTGKVLAGHILTDIYDGSWHHFVMNVVDAVSGNVEVYVDGQRRNFDKHYSQNPSSFTSWTKSIAIGAQNNRGNGISSFFNGSISELRIWNAPRTAGQIAEFEYAEIPADAQGLVAYYTFNDGSGNTLTDHSVNGHHGTLTNMDADNAWIRRARCTRIVGEPIEVFVSNIYSNAGSEIYTCLGGAAWLEATEPEKGTGTWEVVNGNSISVADIHDPHSEVIIHSLGTTILRWVVDASDCASVSDEVTVTIDVCTGINTGLAASVTYYPNPAQTGSIVFSKQLHNVQVANLQGNVVFAADVMKEVTVSEWAAGLYVIKSDEGIYKLEVIR